MSLAMTYDDTQSHLPICGSRMLQDLAYVPAKLNRVCIIKVCFHKVSFLSRRHQRVVMLYSNTSSPSLFQVSLVYGSDSNSFEHLRCKARSG
jgi:hypothetical protein